MINACDKEVLTQALIGYDCPDGIRAYSVVMVMMERLHFRVTLGQIFEPGFHTCSGGCADLEELHIRIYAQDIGFYALNLRVDIRQKVNLIDYTDLASLEHVGIFQRFVITLGYREDDHASALAEIKHGWTNKISNILDKQQ